MIKLPWPKADEESLIRMWNVDGLTYNQCADRLGYSRKAVGAKIYRLREQGVELRELATARTKNPRLWTAEKIRLAEKMIKDGCTYSQIGETIGHSTKAVGMKLRATKIVKPKPVVRRSWSEYVPAPKISARFISDNRDTTGQLMGDPPLERSALYWRAS